VEETVMRNSKLRIAFVVVAGMLVLASCAMPGDDPNFGSKGGPVGLVEEQASTSSDASAIVAQYLSTPTSIGVDAPLPAKPATGKLIVSLSTNTAQDKELEDAMGEAAKRLGWTLTILPVKGTPESARIAFEKALALKPAGIHIVGTQEDPLSDDFAKAEQLGVPVVCTGCVGDPTSALKDTSILGSAQMDLWGQLLAAFITQQPTLDGSDPNIVAVTRPNVPSLAAFMTSFSSNVSTYCPSCTLVPSELDGTLSTSEELDSAVVDAVNVNILANWLTSDDGASITSGLGSALDALGLREQVDIGGNMGTADNIKALADKSQKVWTAYSAAIAGWRVVDSFARIFENVPVVNATLPTQLMTQDNVATLVLDETGNYVGVADYQKQFSALWKVE
jgi:ABC-type sugar transport system substrate-binding protein